MTVVNITSSKLLACAGLKHKQKVHHVHRTCKEQQNVQEGAPVQGLGQSHSFSQRCLQAMHIFCFRSPFDVHFRNVNLSVNTFTYIVLVLPNWQFRFFLKPSASRLTSTQTHHCHQCAISCLHTAYHFAEITLPEAAEVTTLHNTA